MTATARVMYLALVGCLGYSNGVVTEPLRAQELEGLEAPAHNSRPAPSERHTTMGRAIDAPCRAPDSSPFENIQIETTDIHLYEQLFEVILQASLTQRLDHPHIDHIRAYCYRQVLIVIRQDLRASHPTGWVQLNFSVRNVAVLQQELEATARTALDKMDAETREKIVRLRLKRGVMRNNRKVDRLEVYGPEGFMIGFDQPQQ